MGGGGGGCTQCLTLEEESVHMIEENTFSKELFPSLWISLMIYDIYQSRFAAV